MVNFESNSIMRTRAKFIAEVANKFTLDSIKRIDVKFDPFHPNAGNVREFFQAASEKKAIKSNPECITKAKIVCDNSDPLVTIQFKDNHKLVINGKHLESGHFVKLIRHFRNLHKDEPEPI